MLIRLIIISVAYTLVATACASKRDDEPEQFTEAITTINGSVPTGELLPLQNLETMLDTIDANGLRLVIIKGIRKAGTRVGIHIHKYGGHTCVISGEITDFVEGKEPQVYQAGSCYYMPPNTPMSAANLGDEDAVLIDTFNLPEGEPTIIILEPNWPA